MTTLTHAAVGGVLGTCGFGSTTTFVLGVASHYPLDLIPHWDLKYKWLDTVLTLGVLGALLALYGPGPVFWGAAGGALPHQEHKLPTQRKIFTSQGPAHGRPLPGRFAAVQGAVFLASAFLIVRFG